VFAGHGFGAGHSQFTNSYKTNLHSMFSLDRFYNILHNNLIKPFDHGTSLYHYPFGTYTNQFVLTDQFETNSLSDSDNLRYQQRKQSFFHCYFFDQEPIYNYTLPIINRSSMMKGDLFGPRHIKILANSEHSQIKNEFIKSKGYYDWYYFYHGFATLDWYRDFQYLESSFFNNFDKVFICYNNLISKYRSHRLHLVANILEKQLENHGKVSLSLSDNEGTWKQTIENPESPLDSRARIKIFHSLKNLTAPLIIDSEHKHGSMSAKINITDLTSALFHVVTETVYFLPKLHLTEKVFKPIVAKRPFLLVAAPGNLEYLKSYGFRTFDQWIDESYDQETDHYIRIEKITAEIERLCNLSSQQLTQMHTEMQDTLEYNFKHFYGNFKNIIVDELVDNFAHILCQINNGRQPGNHSRYHQRFELSSEYLEQVKKRLKQ
jgi:hypothetical protein